MHHTFYNIQFTHASCVDLCKKLPNPVKLPEYKLPATPQETVQRQYDEILKSDRDHAATSGR